MATGTPVVYRFSQPPDPTFRAWLWSLPLMVGFALGLWLTL